NASKPDREPGAPHGMVRIGGPHERNRGRDRSRVWRPLERTLRTFGNLWVSTDSHESLAKIMVPMQDAGSRYRKPCLVVGIALAFGMLLSAAARAQQTASPTNPTPIELAKSVHNPFEDFVKVPIQATTGFNLGNHHDTGEALNIEPLIPIRLNAQW